MAIEAIAIGARVLVGLGEDGVVARNQEAGDGDMIEKIVQRVALPFELVTDVGSRGGATLLVG
jgi:hypothetical protein